MSIGFHLDVPYVTFAEYGRRMRITEAAARQQAEKGLLPVYEQKLPGKEQGRKYINLALMFKQALEA